MSDDAETRRIDLLMPDGKWYRTIEKFPDLVRLLRNLFLDEGEFIATHQLNPDDHRIQLVPEILVRGTCVQAMCWVEVI